MIKNKLASMNALLPLFLFFCILNPNCIAKSGWSQADKIIERITPPVIPDKNFNITDFGAIGDGKSDCTQAFKKAIDAASKAGGGKVIVPAGIFLTGAIHLKSNINLYLSQGATIKFSDDPNMYLPVVYTRWEGIECMNYSPLIYAYNQKNIAITGRGTLDGNGKNWWRWRRTERRKADRAKLVEYGRENVPVKDRQFAGGKLNPNMIEPYKCENILIEGIRIINGPFWHIHPVLSKNIIVRNVRVDGIGPNNDGCDPESCKDVLITGCFFNTGDDCIAIKSGRNNDARRVNVPSENIIVKNCTMKAGHAGVAIGSEITGGARNIFVENCTMDDPNQERAIRLKTNAARGGFIENVYVRNLKIGQVKEAILLIDFFYQDIEKGNYKPVVKNINLENITSQKSKHALFLRGFANAPIRDVRLTNCTLENNSSPDVVSNVKNLVMKNVKINGKIVK